MLMLNRLLIALFLFTHVSIELLECLSGVQAAAIKQRAVVGELRLHRFPSKIFGNSRTLRVLLPAGYYDVKNRTKRYPVLYLNDGQNLFDARTSVFNRIEWQVDENVYRLISLNKIVPLIVVGIDNSGKRLRPREYLPYEDKFLSPPEPAPDGKKYPDFITSEVMPFINERYRTRTDADGTGIGGSSYGAVAALYTVMAKPGVFGSLLLESPSLYISEGQLLKDSQGVNRWPSRIYIGVGTNEGGRKECKPGEWHHEAVQDVLKLQRIIKESGLDEERLKVVVDECATHDESAWGRRLSVALEFLFGRRKAKEG
jgi:predicted alpha/beta superfamily hydrolase